MRSLIAACLTLSTLVLTTSFVSTADARPKEGGYFALGIGYGAVSGDRGVALEPGSRIVPDADEWIRTDFGSGLSFDIRFGWLIGPIAPEISLFGHGTFDAEDGAALPAFQLRFHPLMLVDSLADSPIDASLFFGVGYAIGGYHHEGSDDGKGWDGLGLTFGLGATYQLSEKIHLGLDLKFAMPMYSTWIFDYDDDETYKPESTPSTLVIAPALTLFASF
ncbi:MAG TPA: hypothetical protein PK095_19340 [Myxococcota bacterium]|nr:hypothetical protein [Myxococcota bacterium]